MAREFNLPNGKSIKLSSDKKIQDWIKAESATWNWINSEDRHISNAFQPIWSLLSNSSKFSNQLLENPENQQIRQQLDSQLNSIQQHISSGSYIASRSDLGRYIMSIKDVDSASAGDIWRAAIMQKNQTSPNDVGFIRGVTLLTVYEHGISKSSIASSRRLFSSTVSEIQEKSDEFTEKSEELIDTVAAMIEQREKKVRQSTTNLAKILKVFKGNLRQEQFVLRGETKDKVTELIDDTKMEISRFENYYETKIALQEPISYWRKKRKGHIFGTIVSGIVFLLLCASIASTFYRAVYSFDGGVSSFIEFWGTVGLPVIGIVAIATALVLVFARVVYRLFASQLHLWNDASERVTMTQTYLALAEKGHAKDEFLGALLGRLFAPASDGVVKDDLGPVVPLDALANRIAK